MDVAKWRWPRTEQSNGWIPVAWKQKSFSFIAIQYIFKKAITSERKQDEKIGKEEKKNLFEGISESPKDVNQTPTAKKEQILRKRIASPILTIIECRPTKSIRPKLMQRQQPRLSQKKNKVSEKTNPSNCFRKNLGQEKRTQKT